MAGRAPSCAGYWTRRTALPFLLASLTVAGLAAGCGSQPAGGARTGPITPLPQAAATASGQPASVSPGPALQGHAIGEKVASDNGLITATVYAFQEPAASGARPDRAGDEWAAIDVEACADPTAVFQSTVDSGPWSLRYSDGTSVPPSRSTAAQFPRPAYPGTPYTLHAGKCVRGWIVFAVPSGERPQVIRYAPQGATPIDWIVQ